MGIENEISPKFMVDLIQRIYEKMWEHFKGYRAVSAYIEKWHHIDEFYENFHIYKKEDGNIDLFETLKDIDNETLIKIAIDLGIETPGFIPSIPTFKNILKEKFPSTYDTFEKATKQVFENPDVSIGLANSVLESLIKEMLKYTNINFESIKKKTLYELTPIILKEFNFYPKADIPKEIKIIGSSLLNITKAIEDIRSDKTDFHGKTSQDVKINESLYAYFIINIVATLGLFFEGLLSEITKEKDIDDELPF